MPRRAPERTKPVKDVEDAKRGLFTLARSEGARWASSELEALAAAGRPPAGGWPGTLSEARVRMDTALAAHRPVVDRQTSEELAHHLYDVAREHWRARSVRETPI